jgi:NAD+ synthase (glutamine-hydrolysing)
MPQLRLALAQIDVTVGDLTANSAAVLSWSRAAAARGAHLVVFPEMALTGYPPEDLVLRDSFRAGSTDALEQLAHTLADEGLGDLAVVVGYLDADGGPRNAAAMLHGGRVVARYFKHHLPNYGVFDEARYFRRGDTFTVVRLCGIDVALTICEDLWQDGGPFAVAARAEVGLVLSINGSPYERNKDDERLDLAARRAREAGTALAYVNMVGGQDELVYDGDSMVVDAAGRVIARAPQFVETLFVVDLDLPGRRGTVTGPTLGMTVERHLMSDAAVPAYDPLPPTVAEPLSEEAEIYAALVAGTRDYVDKNGFERVYIALSGGIDSALTTTIAVDALGADRVHAVAMPSRWSTEHSLGDAEELVRRQGVHYQVVPIAEPVDAVEKHIELHGLAAENLQARIRGVIVMGLSNEHPPSIVLTTGNKSELATGYSTLYGDSAGGFAPIKDVPKTVVWALSRWRNAEADKNGETPPIPENSITKPPSAELRPGQLDTDSLPDYGVLDAILVGYVDEDRSSADLVADGHDPQIVERVIGLVDRAEYKRRQYPPGPKISVKAFGRDRRLPITSRWKETAPPPE